jgi:hypothetical protein
MKTLLLCTALLLGIIQTLFAQSLTFSSSGTSMTFSQTTAGRLTQSTYPLSNSYFSYDQQFNRISIYYNSSPRITIFAGFLTDITIGGQISNNAKLLELTTRLGVSALGGSVTATTTEGSTGSIASSVTKNFVASDTTVNISNASYWCVCNVGTINATLTFAGSPATPLLPGQCVFESSSYDEVSKQLYLPNPATVTVGPTAQVQLIIRPR